MKSTFVHQFGIRDSIMDHVVVVVNSYCKAPSKSTHTSKEDYNKQIL